MSWSETSPLPPDLGPSQRIRPRTQILHKVRLLVSRFPTTLPAVVLIDALTDESTSYMYRHFTDDDKMDKWAHIVAPASQHSQKIVDKREAGGPAPVHSPLDVFATILSPTASLSHTAQRTNIYVHLIQRSGYNAGLATGATVKIDVGDDSIQLREGDGVYITLTPGGKVGVQNAGEKDCELLLFDTE